MHHICARVQMSILQDVPLSFYFLNFPPETYCVCGWFPLVIGYKTSFAHEGDHVDVTSCSEGCMCNITSYGNVEHCRKTPPCFNILRADLFGVYSCAKSGFNGKLYESQSFVPTKHDFHGSERGWITIHTLAVSEAELSRCTWGGDWGG